MSSVVVTGSMWDVVDETFGGVVNNVEIVRGGFPESENGQFKKIQPNNLPLTTQIPYI